MNAAAQEALVGNIVAAITLITVLGVVGVGIAWPALRDWWEHRQRVKRVREQLRVHASRPEHGVWIDPRIEAGTEARSFWDRVEQERKGGEWDRLAEREKEAAARRLAAGRVEFDAHGGPEL